MATYTYQYVAAKLREEILSGRHAPGDRLPDEIALTKQFGVSRNTVREAVKLLQSEGWIRVARGRYGGLFIEKISFESMTRHWRSDLDSLLQLKQASLIDISEARRLNEVASAELAAIRRTEEEAKLLQQAADATGSITSSNDRRHQLTINGSFHEILAKAAHNPVLFMTTMSLFPLLEGALAEQPIPVPKEKQQHLYEDHCLLAEIIYNKDAENAKLAMYNHLIYLENEVYNLPTHL